MAYSVLFGVFTVLMMIGMPIAFCLGIASLATVLYIGLPPIVVFQQLNSGMNVFAMMAIPFFIFAGDLMVRGGIADRLIRFAAGIVGFFMKLFGFSPAATVLALVLGPLAEEALRQTLTISRGSFAIFLERPFSVWIVGITLAILAAAPLMRRFQPKEDAA